MSDRPGRLAAVLAILVACAGAWVALAPWGAQTVRSQASSPGALFDDAMVRTFDLRFAGGDWERQLDAQPDDAYARADLVVDGVIYPDVGVRYKGNSSSRIAARKKPFNVTIDAFVDGQRLMGYDTINLNNGFVDPTLVREALTYRSLRPYVATPGAAYVRLHVNGAYFGLYVLVQQIEGTFVDEWFGARDDGILFKGDPPDAIEPPDVDSAEEPAFRADEAAMDGAAPPAPLQPRPPMASRPDLRWLGEDLEPYRRAYDLKTDDAGDVAYERLRELTRALDAPAAQGGAVGGAFPPAIERVLDVDRALWYVAAHNLFANFDSYYSGHNYYLYWSEADERFHVLSWDMNESFGVFRVAGVDPGDARTVIEADPFLMSGAADRPLIRRLLGVESYRADYLAHYRALLGGAFSTEALDAQVVAYQDRIRADVQTDPNLLYGMDYFDRNVWEDVRVRPDGLSGGATRAVPGLLRVARLRAQWLASRPELAPPDHAVAAHVRTPIEPRSGDEASIDLAFSGDDRVTGATVHYRVNGGVPQAREMRGGTPSGTWTARLPARQAGDRVVYYVRARLADGRVAFHPASNQLAPWAYTVAALQLPRGEAADLVLNELQADNESTIADPEGEFDDWVEVTNRGSEAVDLAGTFLSDDEENPHAFAFPDVVLDPGAFFLVWCDNDPDQGPDHADFRLSLDGETVVLSTEDAILDQVTFGPQEPDASYGRRTDGAAEWGTCRSPSPRGPNDCPGVGFTPAAPTATPTATTAPTPPEPPSTTPPPDVGSVFLPIARTT